MDVGCKFGIENLLRLQSALAAVHPVHRMPPARPPLQLAPETCEVLKNLYLDTDVGQSDCLSNIAEVGNFEQVLASSVPLALPAGACRLLGLDALIRAKEAMTRPRDHETVLQLKVIRERTGGA